MPHDVDMTAPSSQAFVDGSVVRIKLHDFLTYADAELFPGPRLNLLLGPNGSGKSSIVCALCVGLAGSTKLLGRADDVGQFVRFERDSGFTEIELFFERGNRVIKRSINRDNTTKWTLDGRRSSLAKVREVLDAAHIQIDNLCQFLPQDMVGQFAHLNAAQLLRTTEKAVLNGELLTTHDALVEMQHDVVDKGERVINARASLKLKKSENLSLEREVERIQRHEALQKETETMETKIVWLESEALLDEAKALVKVKDAHEDAYNNARENEVLPAQRLLQAETRALKEAKQGRLVADRAVRETHRRLQTEKEKIETLDQEIQQRADELTQLCSQLGKLAARLERLARNLQKWRDERNAMPDEVQFEREKSALEKEKRSKELERVDMDSKCEAVKRALYESQQILRRAEKKLRALDDEATQRRQVLRKKDPHAVLAAEWVARNQHQLQRTVWGPVALELQVRETLHAQYVEAVVPDWLLGALVVECKEDYDAILEGMKAEGLKVSVVIVQDGRRQSGVRPFSPTQMATFREQFGITGFLDELVTAPDVIHEALRPNKLHSVLVGTDATETVVDQGRDDIFSTLSSGDRGGSFVTPAKRYSTKISMYGDRNAFTRVADLQEPRWLVASRSNDEEKAEITRGIEQANAQITGFQTEIAQLEAQDRVFASSRDQATQRLREIRDAMATRRRLDDRITEGEATASDIRRAMAQDNSVREKAMICTLTGQIADHTRHLQQCFSLQQACVDAAVSAMTAATRIDTGEARVAWVTSRLARAETAIRGLYQVFQDAKAKAVEVSKRATAAKRKAEATGAWEAHEEAFAELSDDLEELRGMIETNKVMLDGFRVDRDVLVRYRRACQEIQQEEAALAALEGDVQTGEDGFNQLKDAYYARLQRVVRQIDASFKDSFQQIGCVGEVVLEARDKDVANWGIERRAQFRKTAKLTAMTATAQSGGEKAVGTIMYLMALQSLTQCPFRLVDEINQGMDEYNERKVFARVSLLACGRKLPQYFVVTPKLINGLTFHRDTTVHFIVNGNYNRLPRDVRQLMDIHASRQPPDAPVNQDTRNAKCQKRR